MKLFKATLFAVLSLAVCSFMCGCDNEPLLSGIIEPIRIYVDDSKTETTDITCTVSQLIAEEYDKTVTDYNYGYGYHYNFSSHEYGYGFGLIPSSNVVHTIDYYMIVTDSDNTFCRFQIDEADYNKYKENDVVIIQKVQEYSTDGVAYSPYFTYNGKKLQNAKWYK